MRSLSGRSVRGRSSTGELDGSYLSLVSLANMGLFATRDAFFRFSTDGRFDGYGETSRSGVALAMSRPGGAGEASSFCQKGDERVGDASNGDESRLTIIF